MRGPISPYSLEGVKMRLKAIALSLLFLAGCVKTVQLTVTNPTDLMHTVLVETRDDSGIPRETIALGNLAPKSNKQEKFNIKPGGSFEVRAGIPGDGTDYRDKRTVTKSDPNPFHYSVNIQPLGNPVTEVNIDTIRDKFKNLQQGYGLPALGVSNALDTMFGAVLVITPAQGQQNARIHAVITPVELGNAMTLKEFQYLDDTESLKLEVTKATAMQLKANFAIYGSFNFSGNTEDVYKLSSELKGFGQYAKVEKPGFNLSKQLSTDQKRDLAAALHNNPGSKLYYINLMWAIKRGANEVYKSYKLSANQDTTAASVITANGAFNFSDIADQKSEYNEVALEFWGEELPPAILMGGATPKMMAGGTTPKMLRLNKELMRSIANAVTK
jgi:hypothetical protein